MSDPATTERQQFWLEPYAYLRTVFTELPRADSVAAIEQLLPIPTNNDLADLS